MARTNARIEEEPGVYPERLTLIRYRCGEDNRTWGVKALAHGMKRPVIVRPRTTDLARAHRVAIEKLQEIETDLKQASGRSTQRRRRPACSFGQTAEEVVAALEARARQPGERLGKGDGRPHKSRCKINSIRDEPVCRVAKPPSRLQPQAERGWYRTAVRR